MIRIELSSGNENIKDGALESCTYLQKIDIHSFVSKIGKTAFSKFSSLRLVKIPSYFTEIEAIEKGSECPMLLYSKFLINENYVNNSS